MRPLSYIRSLFRNDLFFNRFFFLLSIVVTISEYFNNTYNNKDYVVVAELTFFFSLLFLISFILTYTNEYFKRNSIQLLYIMVLISICGLHYNLYINNFNFNIAFRTVIGVFIFSLFFKNITYLITFLILSVSLNLIVLFNTNNEDIIMVEYLNTLFLTGILAYLASVTRLYAIKEINQNEDKLKALFRNASDGITILDENGFITYQSESIINITGYKAEEVIGHNISQYIYEEDLKFAFETLKNSLSEDYSSITISVRLKSKDTNEYKLVECFGRNLLKDPLIKGILVNIRDITEREKNTAEILQLKDQLQSILSSSYDGILAFEPFFDKEGNISGFRCRLANPACEQIFKKSVSEIINLRFIDLFPDAHKTGLFQDVMDVFLGKKEINTELYFDNKVLKGWYYFAIARLANGFSLTIVDISDRKNAENALKENEYQYRLLFQNNPKPMWMYNRETFKILEVNKAAIEHYGYSRDEFLKMTILDVRTPEDRERLLEYSKNPDQKAILNQLVWTHQKKDGTKIKVNIYKSEVTINGVETNIVIVDDITEKQKIEESRAKAERILRKQNTELLRLENMRLSGETDFANRLKEIAKISAQTLEVERVGIWFFDDDNQKLTSFIIYEWSKDSFSVENISILKEDFKKYFSVFDTERLLVAENVFEDLRTVELRETYTGPNNVFSLLDASFRLKGRIRGIICHEHIGQPRVWTLEEQNFTMAMADMLSISLESYERKKAEAALIESEEKYRSLFTSSHDAVVIYDTETAKLLDVNISWENITGYSKEESMQMRVFDISAERDPLTSKFKNIYSTNENSPLTFINTKSGQIIPVEISSSEFYLNGKKVTCSIMRNVSERLESEKTLRDNEEKFRLLFSNSNDAIIIFSENKFIVDCNDSACELFGYSKEALYGKAPVFLAPELQADGSPSNEKTKKMFEEDFGRTFKCQYVKSNGTTFTADVSLSSFELNGVNYSQIIIRDITYKEEFERQLQESEEKYRTLIENMQDGVFVITDNHMAFLNNALASMIGYTTEEMINRPFSDFIAPEDLPMVAERHRQRMSGNFAPDKYDFKLLHKDGVTRVDVNMNVSIISYKLKPSVLGTLKNITESKRTAELIKASEARFATFMDNNPAYSWIKDDNYNYVYVSKALKDYLKIENFVPGTISDSDFYSDEIVQGFVKYDKLILEGGSVQAYMNPYTNQDGVTIYTIVYKFPVLGNDNKRYVGGIAVDITEKIEIENALRKTTMELQESTEKLNSILNSLQNIVWSYDLNTNKLLYVNPIAEQIYGVPLAEFYNSHGKVWDNLVHPDDRAYADRKYQETIAGKKVELEYRVIRPDGTLKWMRERPTVMLDENKNPVRMDGIAIDITEEKKAIELLRAKELAEQSADMKQQFLANMSHEIRTPMNGIVGITEMLLKTKLTGEQHELAEIIKNSADNMMVILNDVLDLSKLEAGKMELKPVTFNIHNTVRKLKGLFSPLAKKKNLEFNSTYDNHLPDYIQADENRIMQILSNLTGNAIKFTDTGSVNVRFSLASEKDEELLVKVEITDTGIGIRPEDQKRLFETFSQLDYGSSRKFNGSGLGLSIVKRLAEMMGGQVGVLSKVDKGSTFWFTFKANRVNNSELEQQMTTSNNITANATKEGKFDIKILLVEDKPINQKVASMMLQNLGCRVEVANHGKEALSMYKESKYDLILMDIQMPVMDGVEATKALKKVYSHTCTIVGLSANSLEGDAERYMSIGMDDYIAKPITMQKLVEKLSKFFPIKSAVSFEEKLKNILIRDEKQLASLNADAEFINQLYTTFIKDIEEVMPQLYKASATKNYSFIQETAHSIKGIAANIGANRIMEVCSKLNENLKLNYTSDCDDLLASLATEVLNFKASLTSELQNNKV